LFLSSLVVNCKYRSESSQHSHRYSDFVRNSGHSADITYAYMNKISDTEETEAELKQ